MNARQDDGLVLGIDLGGTKILAGVVDSEDRVLARAKRSTPAKQGNVAVFEAVWRCAEEAMGAAGVDVGADLGRLRRVSQGRSTRSGV